MLIEICHLCSLGVETEHPTTYIVYKPVTKHKPSYEYLVKTWKFFWCKSSLSGFHNPIVLVKIWQLMEDVKQMLRNLLKPISYIKYLLKLTSINAIKSNKNDQSSYVNILKENISNCSWLAETSECWSLEFQLDATFSDNLGHICRQIMYICRQFYHIIKVIWKNVI